MFMRPTLGVRDEQATFRPCGGLTQKEKAVIHRIVIGTVVAVGVLYLAKPIVGYFHEQDVKVRAETDVVCAHVTPANWGGEDSATCRKLVAKFINIDLKPKACVFGGLPAICETSKRGTDVAVFLKRKDGPLQYSLLPIMTKEQLANSAPHIIYVP